MVSLRHSVQFSVISGLGSLTPSLGAYRKVYKRMKEHCHGPCGTRKKILKQHLGRLQEDHEEEIFHCKTDLTKRMRSACECLSGGAVRSLGLESLESSRLHARDNARDKCPSACLCALLAYSEVVAGPDLLHWRQLQPPSQVHVVLLVLV
jgi:hypothetical protein